MRYTVEYHRDGHHVATRMHTDSYAKAKAHYDRCLGDHTCSNVTFLDRGASE
jgi:hypothetical protein